MHRSATREKQSSMQHTARRQFYPPQTIRIEQQRPSSRLGYVEDVDDFYQDDGRHEYLHESAQMSGHRHVDQLSLSSASSQSSSKYDFSMRDMQAPPKSRRGNYPQGRSGDEARQSVQYLSTEEILQQNADDLQRLQRTWNELEMVQKRLERLRNSIQDMPLEEHQSRKDHHHSQGSELESEISDIPSGLFTGEDDELTKKALREYYRAKRDRIPSESNSSASSRKELQGYATKRSNQQPPRPQSRFGPRPPSRKTQYATYIDDDSSVAQSTLSDDLKQALENKVIIPPYREVGSLGMAPEKSAKPAQGSATDQKKVSTSSSSPTPVAPVTRNRPFRVPDEYETTSERSSKQSFVSDYSQVTGDTSIDTMERVKIDMEDMRLALCYSRSLPDDKRQQFFEEFTHYFNFLNDDESQGRVSGSSRGSHEVNRLKLKRDDSSVAPSESCQEEVSVITESSFLQSETIPTADDVRRMIDANSKDERRLRSIIEILLRVERGSLRQVAERLLLECRTPQKLHLPADLHQSPAISSPGPKSSSHTPSRKPPTAPLPENYFVKNLDLQSPNRFPDDSTSSHQDSMTSQESEEHDIDEHFANPSDDMFGADSYDAESVDHSKAQLQKEQQPYDYSETADTMSTRSTIVSELSPNEADDSENYESEVSSNDQSDQEYTMEMQENEIVVHVLKNAIELMVEKNVHTFSGGVLLQLKALVIDALQRRSGGKSYADTDLDASLKSLFGQFDGTLIRQTRGELTQKVADLLYDEMIFKKVVQQVDKSYFKEIEDLRKTQIALASEVGSLEKQREKDMKKLHAERRRRLQQVDEVLPPNSPGMIDRFRDVLLHNEPTSGYSSDVSSMKADPVSRQLPMDDSTDESEQATLNAREEEEAITIEDLPDAPLGGIRPPEDYKSKLRAEEEEMSRGFVDSLPKPEEGEGLVGDDGELLDPEAFANKAMAIQRDIIESVDLANKMLLLALLGQFKAGNLKEESSDEESEDKEDKEDKEENHEEHDQDEQEDEQDDEQEDEQDDDEDDQQEDDDEEFRYDDDGDDEDEEQQSMPDPSPEDVD